MNDDWRSLGEVVASVTKIKCVTRNRVDRVGIGRAAAVELHHERFVTMIYVSHRMPEVFRLCDRISVLRDGKFVGTLTRAEVTTREQPPINLVVPLMKRLSGIGG